MNDICINSEMHNLSLALKKCSYIAKNVIAKWKVEKIIVNLKICKFFILIESTDITDNKVMCILVRYV